MMARVRYALLVVALAVLSASASARADVAPMDVAGCSGKAPGSKCLTDDGRSGECSEVDWSRIRYGPNGPSGSWSVKVIRCVAPLPPTNSGIAQETPSSGSGFWDELPAGAVAALGAAGLAAVATVVAVLVRRRRTRRTARGGGPQ